MKRLTALCLTLAILLWGGFCAAEGTLPELRLHQISNGNAANYLIMVEDTVIVIDAGINTDNKRANADRLYEYFSALGVDHIDAHIVTHWHNDHALNIKPFNDRFGLDTTVVYGPSQILPERFQPLTHGRYQQLRDGDRVRIGPTEVLCIAPERADVSGENNRDSLNFILTYGAHRFVFTGDWMDYTVMHRHKEDINRVDVFCFPHHGLKPMCVRPATMRQLSPRVILVPGSGASEDCVKDFIFHECSVKVMPRFYSNRDGHVQVISDGVTLSTAYKIEPGDLPAGKPLK